MKGIFEIQEIKIESHLIYLKVVANKKGINELCELCEKGDNNFINSIRELNNFLNKIERK